MSDHPSRNLGPEGGAKRGGRGGWSGRRGEAGFPNSFATGPRFHGSHQGFFPGRGQLPRLPFQGRGPPFMHGPPPPNGRVPGMGIEAGYVGYGQPGYGGQQWLPPQEQWQGGAPAYMQYGAEEAGMHQQAGQGHPAWGGEHGSQPWYNPGEGQPVTVDPSSPSPPPPPPPDEDEGGAAELPQAAKPLPPWLQNGGTDGAASQGNGVMHGSQADLSAEAVQPGAGSGAAALPGRELAQAAESGTALVALTPVHQAIPAAGDLQTPPSAKPSSGAPTPVKFQMKKPVKLQANPNLLRGLPIRAPAKKAASKEPEGPEDGGKASPAAAAEAEKDGSSGKRKSSRWGEEVRKEKKTRWGRDETAQSPADPSSPQDPASPGAEIEAKAQPGEAGAKQGVLRRLEKWRQRKASSTPPPAVAKTPAERRGSRRSPSRSSSSSSSGSDTSSSSGRYRTPPPAPRREAAARHEASPFERYDEPRGFGRRLERDRRRRTPSRSPGRDRHRWRNARRYQDNSPDHSTRYSRGSRRDTYRRSPDDRHVGRANSRYWRPPSRSPVRRSRRPPPLSPRLRHTARDRLADAAQPVKDRLKQDAPEEGEVADPAVVPLREESAADVDMEVEPLGDEEEPETVSDYNLPTDRAPPISNAARLKEQDEIVKMNRELKVRIAGICRQHGLDGSPSQQTVLQMEDAWRRVRASLHLMDQQTSYENVVLTFDADSADERSEVSDDIACLGDPSAWGFPSWLPPPLASLDNAPPVMEASPWNPLEREVSIPFTAEEEGTPADPRPYALVAEQQGAASPPRPQLLPVPPFALIPSEKEEEGPNESWSTSPRVDAWDTAISGSGAPVAAENRDLAASLPVAAEQVRWPVGQVQPAHRPAEAVAQLSAPAPPPLHLAPAHLKHPEPEQGQDWNLIGREGVLDVSEAEDWQSLAYWRKRAFAGTSSRAVPGACAHRSADNLWLPLTEASIQSSDLEWEEKDNVPESRLRAGRKGRSTEVPLDEGCKLTSTLSDSALQAWLDAATAEACGKTTLLELPAAGTDEALSGSPELNATLSEADVLYWFNAVTPATILSTRQEIWAKQAAESHSHRRREAQQASNRVWGAPPPPHVAAMLRGRLALRVLGGVEGNTLVAQVIEDAFERVMAKEPERIAARKAREAEEQRQAAEARKAREAEERRQAEAQRAARKRETEELARRNLQAKRDAAQRDAERLQEAKRERERREDSARRRSEGHQDARRRTSEPSAGELAEIERRREKRRREDEEGAGRSGHRKEPRKEEQRDADRHRGPERRQDVQHYREGSMYRDEGRPQEGSHPGSVHRRPEGGHRSRQHTPEPSRHGSRGAYAPAQNSRERSKHPAAKPPADMPDVSAVQSVGGAGAMLPGVDASQHGVETLPGILPPAQDAEQGPAEEDAPQTAHEERTELTEAEEAPKQPAELGQDAGEAALKASEPQEEAALRSGFDGDPEWAEAAGANSEAARAESEPAESDLPYGGPTEADGGKSAAKARGRGRRKQDGEALGAVPQPRAPEPVEADDSQSDEDYAPVKRGKLAPGRGRGRGKAGRGRRRSGSQVADFQEPDAPAAEENDAAEGSGNNEQEDLETDAEAERAAEEKMRRKILAQLVPNELNDMWSTLRKFDQEQCNSTFAEPVAKADAPGYYDFIKQPMDFKTLGKKISKFPKDMSGLEALKADVDLIVQNCIAFNEVPGEENEYVNDANRLARKAEEAYQAARARIASAIYIPRRR